MMDMMIKPPSIWVSIPVSIWVSSLIDTGIDGESSKLQLVLLRHFSSSSSLTNDPTMFFFSRIFEFTLTLF